MSRRITRSRITGSALLLLCLTATEQNIQSASSLPACVKPSTDSIFPSLVCSVRARSICLPLTVAAGEARLSHSLNLHSSCESLYKKFPVVTFMSWKFVVFWWSSNQDFSIFFTFLFFYLKQACHLLVDLGIVEGDEESFLKGWKIYIMKPILEIKNKLFNMLRYWMRQWTLVFFSFFSMLPWSCVMNQFVSVFPKLNISFKTQFIQIHAPTKPTKVVLDSSMFVSRWDISWVVKLDDRLFCSEPNRSYGFHDERGHRSLKEMLNLLFWLLFGLLLCSAAQISEEKTL